MTPLEKVWVDYTRSLLLSKPDAYVQIRKLFQGKYFEIPWDTFDTGIETTYPYMGYTAEDGKSKQLIRNYLNVEEIEKARTKFISRLEGKGNKSKQSCITVRMGNGSKNKDSQGFCIQCITLNHLVIDKEDNLIIDIYYRTTEFTQKFFADLKFLHENVFPMLLEDINIKPVKVNFIFSTVYISLMFLPILYQFENPLEILKDLKKADPKYFKWVLKAAEKLMSEDTNYNFRTRLNLHLMFRKLVLPQYSKKLVKDLNSFIKKEIK